MKKSKKILALIVTVCMMTSMLSGITLVQAAVLQDQRPENPTSNLVIGILDDTSTAAPDAFPNEPSITGLDYFYVKYNNNGYSLTTNYLNSTFSSNAGNYINTAAFWNDERIISNSAGNAFGFYSPTGLDLSTDPFFVTGFGASFSEEDIIKLWMGEKGISGVNASEYELLFYVMKYEISPWGDRYSAYHLDAKVVKKNSVVLAYDANKPDGVTADIILPDSHSVAPNTDVTVVDLGSEYIKQTANGLNYSFSGWNTKADGSGTAYVAGNTIAVAEDTILYAQWDITNKYEVAWVNYNDEVLYSTGYNVSYGDPVPSYEGETPTQPNSATHTYTFSHWELVEGTYSEATGVTEDLVYKTVYTDARITHKAIVQVVLNGTFDQNGNPSSTNPGTPISIDQVASVDENALYIKTVDGTEYIKLEEESTGIYSNDAVGNGSYLIYRKDDGAYVQVGTQELTINNADRTRYLPYYSVVYENGFGGIFWEEYYYIGSEVDVISDVPRETGYVFLNWTDEENVSYNPSTALLTQDIIDSITKGYVLTAQWDMAAQVSVTVVADHNDRQEEPTGDLTLHLTREDTPDTYNQVAGATVYDIPASEWFDNDLSSTTYYAGVVYEDLNPSFEYAAHAAIPGYRSHTERNGGAVEVNFDSVANIYAVTLYLIYDPDGYELEFEVKIDENIEDRFVPEAVDVRVTRFNADNGQWEVIPQHEYQSVEVKIDKTTRQGSGRVHVWGFNGADPYLYRIEVMRVDLGTYQIDMAPSTDHINYTSAESGFFPAGAYEAVVTVDSHLDDGNGLKGAHADKTDGELEHHGSILATVTAVPYTISLDPNGGEWENQSTDAEIIRNRFTVPDLASYIPAKENHTFAGWVVKGTDTAVRASDYIINYVDTAGGTLELEAVWNENITVTGTIVVDLGYYCDDDSRQVMVVLQRREGDGTYYVDANNQIVPLGNPNGTYVTGSYSFVDVPNLDTYHYRINVVVVGGGTVLYQNAPDSLDPANLMVESKYNENDFVVEVVELDGDLAAVVNVYMKAIPFELGYMVVTSAIAEGFRPTDLTLDLWHDHQVGEEEEYHQIISLLDFVGTFTDGVSAIETVLVPPYHANGRLYDYTISVLSYDLDEYVMAADANGWNDRHYYHYDTTTGYFPAPFTIRYTGPAEYNEMGIEEEGTTYKQDVILKAIFEPNTYAINYELNGGYWESGNVGPTHHKWSFETEIPTPVRNGYLFTGWTVTPVDTEQGDIYDDTEKHILAKAWTDVTFTANWKKDEWTDGTPDSQSEGDEVPDEEQVRIIYASANPAFGTVDKELDIVPLAGGTVTASATATPVDINHEFVRWTCETVTIDDPGQASLNQSFTATGGETYVFIAEFKAVDDWTDGTPDSQSEGDGTPDVQQVRIVYSSGNRLGGSVSRGLDIITLEPAGSTVGDVSADDVTATANPGYEFAGWKLDETPITDNEVLNPAIQGAIGGETYEYVADFTPIDRWNADDDTDTPDSVYDMYQVKVHFESSNTTMGNVAPEVDIITIPGAVSHGTVTAESVATANSGHRFVKWSHEDAQVGTAASLSYPIEATGGSEYTFIADFEYRGGGGGGGTPSYTLKYESNGGTEYKDERYTSGKTVELDKTPVRSGYIFTGWYSDEELTEKISSVVMKKNTTVYAGWEENVPSNPPGSLNSEDHFAYIIGYPDETVRPENKITRAEVATIFFRLLKEEVRSSNITEENVFTDVLDGQWHNVAISTLAKLGIVEGRTPTLFMPDEYITRAEFAAICARFDDDLFEVVDNFSDVQGHWAEDEIHEAAAHGWIKGYEDNTFRPERDITRAEAMTLINRVLCRLPETKADLLDDMIIWSDNTDETAWYYIHVQEATNSHEYNMRTEAHEKWTKLTENIDWASFHY